MSEYRATPTWWDNGRNPDGSPAVRKVWTVEGPEPFGGLTAVDEAQALAVVGRLAELERERDAAGNRGDYLRAHQLLCDLARRFKKALLPTTRIPDWDSLVAEADRLAGLYHGGAPGPEVARNDLVAGPTSPERDRPPMPYYEIRPWSSIEDARDQGEDPDDNDPDGSDS
jgi:hypothetical protein